MSGATNIHGEASGCLYDLGKVMRERVHLKLLYIYIL